MSTLLLLDAGPLGLITQPQRSHEVITITDWLKNCLRAGARVLVPAIVYYEIRRELLRANKAVGIASLGAFAGNPSAPYRKFCSYRHRDPKHLSQFIPALLWKDINPGAFGTPGIG